MFSYKWKAKLAKRGFFIKLSLNFVKAFKADCDLTASNIQENISLILGVILLTFENESRQKEINIRQNLICIGIENKDMPQQNNPRHLKRKQDGEDKGSGEARLEKICTQATKVAMKKVKTATEKVQSPKVKKAETIWNNVKRTLTKTIRKKKELNKIPDIDTATRKNEGAYNQNKILHSEIFFCFCLGDRDVTCLFLLFLKICNCYIGKL